MELSELSPTRIRRTVLVVLGAVLTVGGCTSGAVDKASGTGDQQPSGTASTPATSAAGSTAISMMDDITGFERFTATELKGP